MNFDLKNKILKLFEEDQETLKKFQKGEVSLEEVRHVGNRHTDFLKNLLQNNSFPLIPECDIETFEAVFAMVQHSPSTEFQKVILDFWQKFPAENVPKKYVAYLIDRVRVREKHKQLYGTQVVRNNGMPALAPVEDPEGLEERRKEMGLESSEEYLKKFNN